MLGSFAATGNKKAKKRNYKLGPAVKEAHAAALLVRATAKSASMCSGNPLAPAKMVNLARAGTSDPLDPSSLHISDYRHPDFDEKVPWDKPKELLLAKGVMADSTWPYIVINQPWGSAIDANEYIGTMILHRCWSCNEDVVWGVRSECESCGYIPRLPTNTSWDLIHGRDSPRN